MWPLCQTPLAKTLSWSRNATAHLCGTASRKEKADAGCWKLSCGSACGTGEDERDEKSKPSYILRIFLKPGARDSHHVVVAQETLALFF